VLAVAMAAWVATTDPPIYFQPWGFSMLYAVFHGRSV
jgi:hypothetical protein